MFRLQPTMQSSWLNRNHSQPTVLPRRPCLGSATLLRARQASARPVFAAAKPTQAADFRSLSAADIDKEVEQSKVELFKLRLQQSRREAFKPSDFVWHKKKIAQLLTVKRQKEIENGIDLRASRRTQKKKNVEAGFPQF